MEAVTDDLAQSAIRDECNSDWPTKRHGGDIASRSDPERRRHLRGPVRMSATGRFWERKSVRGSVAE